MLRWLKRRVVVHFVIAALFVVPMIGALSIKPNRDQPFASKVRLWFDSLEYSTIDYRIYFGRTAKALPSIVFLSIDAPSVSLDVLDDQTIAASSPLSLMHASGFPFPREVYADACNRLFGAGAKVVGFDLLFRAPSPSDPLFQQALDKYRDQVVIGLNFNDDSTSYTLPPISLLPSQDPLDDRLGYFNFWQDSDGVMRHVQYRNNLEYENQQEGAEKLPKLYSLAARIVQKAGCSDLIPDDLAARPLRYAGPSRFRSFSFYKIFDPHSWAGDFKNGEFFKGKIVLVGPEGNWSKDVLPTPWGLMAGAEIHLNAINALLQAEFLHPVPDETTSWLVIGSGVLVFLLAMGIPSIATRFLAAAFLLGGYVEALVWAYNGPGWLLPAVGPIGVFSGATGIGFVYDFVLTQVEKFQLRATFERYTSPNEAKYLLEHKDSYKQMLVGARKPVTILFSDIRGFTTMTEKADSQELVTKLNEYLTAMVDCVFRHDGSLDKFIGDAVVAAWGKTPYNFGPKEDAIRAVRSALAMMSELHRLNAKWIGEGREEWHIGIGLNHGQVIVGDIGSQKRKEFAVIGDAVNLASRLESLTKEYKVDILIGESVVELVRDQFHLQTVDLVQVVGKTEPVKTFTVLGEKTESLPAWQQQFLTVYEEGIHAFRGREFARAKDLFAQALKSQPGDHLAEQYRASCEAFILNPPDASWTGVRVMTKK